jgi:hypothetical protein
MQAGRLFENVQQRLRAEYAVATSSANLIHNP